MRKGYRFRWRGKKEGKWSGVCCFWLRCVLLLLGIVMREGGERMTEEKEKTCRARGRERLSYVEAQ